MKNKNLKTTLAAGLVILISLLALFYLEGKKTSNKLTAPNQNIVVDENFTNQDEIIEQDQEAKEVQEELVREYISSNISELSPEKEVLGGKFFVTEINFIDANSALVEYEDGHIALSAEVGFTTQGNEVIIESFIVLTDKFE